MLDRPLRAAALALGVASLAACFAPGTPVEPYAGPPIERLVRSISASAISVTAAPQGGGAPAAGTAGPLTVAGVPAIINGGSAPVTVSAPTPITRVFLEAVGYTGHWAVTLPAGTASANLILVLSDSLSGATTRFRWRAEVDGQITPIVQQNVQTIRVGSGEVQLSVAWTGASDVDLWAFGPSGDTVYFGNLTSRSGGRLDLDSNPACSIDNKNNENIVWASNAPRGQYRVQVRYFADCGVPRSDWVATAAVRGQTPRIASGSFVGQSGTANPAVDALTFTY